MTKTASLRPRPARQPRLGSQPRPGYRDGSRWRVPAALLALTAIPLISGSLRLVEVAGGPQLLPVNARITASPAPLVLHVVAATVHAAAGTQAFTQGVGEGVFGTSDLSTGLSVSSGWLVNAAVAEWIIRRPGAHRPEARRSGRARTTTFGA